MKSGSVVFFFYEDTIFGKAIQYYNLRNYNLKGPTHVGIISDVKKDYVEIYEALGSGFVKKKYEKWWLDLKIKEKIISIKHPVDKIKYVKDKCEAYENIPYGWLDIISIYLSYRTGFKLKGITNSKKIICSEAVARVLYDCSNKKINFEKEFDKSYDLITPMDLFLSKFLVY